MNANKPLPSDVMLETIAPSTIGKRYPLLLSVSGTYRLSFSAGYIKQYKFESKTLARLSISESPPVLAFSLLDRTGTAADDLCFGLHRNSSSSRCASRTVIARSLFGRSPHLEAIRAHAKRRRRPVNMPILHDPARGLFYVEMRTALENIWRPGQALPAGYAVYRYLDGDEAVYLGEGELSERLREERRCDWKFDYVEFTLVKTKKDGAALERHLLDEHRSLFGRLPRYNARNGKKN